MASLQELISSERIKARDTTASNFIRKETPDGLNDGSNAVFRLENRNIVAGSLYVTVNSTFRSKTLAVITDATNGIITFNSAPASAADPFYMDYNYLWCTDEEVRDFLNEGSRLLLNGGNDPTLVTEGLIPALQQFALYFYFQAIASQYGRRYSSSGGQAGQSVEAVTKDFLSKADASWKIACTMRDDFYKRQGQREAPASGVITFSIDPYTPRR